MTELGDPDRGPGRRSCPTAQREGGVCCVGDRPTANRGGRRGSGGI